MSKPRPPRTGDVVEVRWVDSEHIALGWESTSKYIAAASDGSSYRGCGYWIEQGSENVLLVMMLDPANGTVTHGFSIPRVAITEVQVLGRANKRVRKAISP